MRALDDEISYGRLLAAVEKAEAGMRTALDTALRTCGVAILEDRLWAEAETFYRELAYFNVGPYAKRVAA